MRSEGLPEGWYYKQNGQTCGPVSAEQLQAFLTTGQLHSRQAVWKRDNQSLLFVHAATAAFGTKRQCPNPALSGSVSAEAFAMAAGE